MDMPKMDSYGLRVFRNGVEYHSDRRRRRKTRFVGVIIEPALRPPGGYRGKIKAFSFASLRRLRFVFANACSTFRSLLTLTYHAASDRWDDPERNGRIARRSKADLNRFLTAMRPQMGAYLWVQEFQQRGVVHYHLICERELFEPEVRFVWCRAINALDDAAARLYAARVDAVRNESSVRKYLAHYLGKRRQKRLPPGVEGAGRWWGASRSVEINVVHEIVSWRKNEPKGNEAETRTVRLLRRFVSRAARFKFRGGTIVDWSGELSARVERAAQLACAFYGESPTELLARFGWERTVEQ
jgi:hypothetical protein